MDYLYPLMTDPARDTETKVSDAEWGESITLAATPALPAVREGRPWPKDWRTVALDGDIAPPLLFKLVYDLVRHCVRDRAQNLEGMPKGYLPSIATATRLFVNAEVVPSEGGAFPGHQRQVRAVRHTMMVERPPPAKGLALLCGRPQKPLVFLCPSPDLLRPGDVERCITGELYMPAARRAAPALTQKDLSYNNVFVDTQSRAYGMFGSRSDVDVGKSYFGQCDRQREASLLHVFSRFFVSTFTTRLVVSLRCDAHEIVIVKCFRDAFSLRTTIRIVTYRLVSRTNSSTAQAKRTLAACSGPRSASSRGSSCLGKRVPGKAGCGKKRAPSLSSSGSRAMAHRSWARAPCRCGAAFVYLARKGTRPCSASAPTAHGCQISCGSNCASRGRR